MTNACSNNSLVPKTRPGRFFFSEEVPYGLAALRILLPLVLLLVMVPRWFHARELYSADGAPAPLAANYGVPDFVSPVSGSATVALCSALVFFLLTSSIGWFTRFSLIASTVIYVYLNLLDSLSSITKYSVIASHAMLLLSLSGCGAVWSVDAWRQSRRRSVVTPWQPDDGLPRFPAWPRRLMQLFIGVVYFGAALTKIHTPAYFSSDQLLYWTLTDLNHDNLFGEYLSAFPPVLAIAAYFALVWEILFLFLCWSRFGRLCMLTLGVAFHVMTTFMLGLYIFPLVSISIYFCFLDEEDVSRVARLARRARRKFAFGRWFYRSPTALGKRVPEWLRPGYGAAATFGGVASFVVLIGLQLEHLQDPYGIRRPEGPYELKAIDQAEVARLFTPTSRIRVKDKFLDFRVGTQVVAGTLLNEKYTYRHGDCLLAQCILSPPHEDMWVECNLHDADDHEIFRQQYIIPRDSLRADFPYSLGDALSPGEYHLVVKAGGKEITRRRITLKPRIDSPVAN